MDERRVRVTNYMTPKEAKFAIWRPGRKVGRTIYAQIFAIPHDNDVLLGMVDDPELAQHICDLHNEALRPHGNVTTPTYLRISENKMNMSCARCGAAKSETWWKCCPRHCSEQGDDVMCDTCKDELHPLGV